MTKGKKSPRTSSIRKNLLSFIVPFLSVAFIILMFMIFNLTSSALSDSAKRTLEKEATSNTQAVAMNLIQKTSTSDFHLAYTTAVTQPHILDKIYSTIDTIEVLDCGYAFLVDVDNNTILAHPNNELVGTIITETDPTSFLGNVAEIIQLDNEVVQPDEDVLITSSIICSPVYQFADDSEDYYVIASQIEGTPWIVVSCVPASYITDTVISIGTRIFAIIIAILILTIISLIFFINRTVKPIRKLTKSLTDITDGDFSVKIETKGNNEITVMSRALKDFVEIMREVITDIRNVSSQLNEHSESSKQVSDTLKNTAGVQAESMGDMQTTLDQVVNSIQELAFHAATLSEVVVTTSTSGSQANDRMQQTVSVAAQGKEDMEIVEKTMTSIVDSMKQLEENVLEVGTSTEQITSIAGLISEIAEQTNLLSLNAAIEAARAGEAGRGFAVVAEEIRKLAEVSSSSATQITDIIEKISTQVGDMVANTKESVQYIEENSEKITASCEVFDTIYQDVTSTSEVLKNIVIQMGQVDDVSTNMAALSEEESASTEEILASTQVLAENSLHISSDSKAVAESSDAVAEASFTLAEHMRKFKI